MTIKDLEYVKAVLLEIKTRCKCENTCRLCELRDFCETRHLYGIDQQEWMAITQGMQLKVRMSNGEIKTVDPTTFARYLHTICYSNRSNPNIGCRKCKLMNMCNRSKCFTTGPDEWEI